MRNYVSRLHVVGIVTLAVLTVALALFGWSLRPASGGYPVLETGMTVTLLPGVPSVTMEQSLTHSANGGGSLTLLGSDAPASQKWSVYLYKPDSGWRLCTPRNLTFDIGGALTEEPLQRQHIRLAHIAVDNDLGEPYELDGSGDFYVKLCWSEGGPVQVNGAYLSAQFMAVQRYPAPLDTMGRYLIIGEGTTADYSIQSPVQPSGADRGSFHWSQPQPITSLAVSAVNASDTQHDSYQAFLSGILFGVAGGAGVALIQEFVAPFRTRRELRPPEPGG